MPTAKEIEEFEEDLISHIEDERLEVLRIEYCPVTLPLSMDTQCEIYPPTEKLHPDHIGTYAGIDVFGTLYPSDDDDYRIICDELFQLCKKCSSKLMFDEVNDTHYCPMCDNTRKRVKDKIYRYVG